VFRAGLKSDNNGRLTWRPALVSAPVSSVTR
jgi:hypothetical protein